MKLPTCICGSDDYREVFKSLWLDSKGKLRFSVMKCNKCNLMRTTPLPLKTTSTLSDIRRRLDNMELWENFSKILIKKIKKFLKKDKLKVLDIGSNIGVMVRLAGDLGWESIGIDLDKNAVEIGRNKFNIDLRSTGLLKEKFKNRSFDVVILDHTLEHITNPEPILREIKRILAKDGIIVIRVPNIEGLPVKIQNFRHDLWYGYNPRQHIWHFAPRTLCDLLKKVGFKMIEVDVSKPQYYEKTGRITDFIRGLILAIAGLLRMADQATVVAANKCDKEGFIIK